MCVGQSALFGAGSNNFHWHFMKMVVVDDFLNDDHDVMCGMCCSSS